jgi:hypothetical protein
VVTATPAQLDHLRAAAAGDLWVNDTGSPSGLRRFSRIGGGARAAVAERCYREGWLHSVPRPGCATLYRCAPTEAGLRVLRAASGAGDHRPLIP